MNEISKNKIAYGSDKKIKQNSAMLRKVIVKRGKFMYQVVTICSSKWTPWFALWIPNFLFSGMKHSFVWLLRMLETAFSQLGLPWNMNLSWSELPPYRKTPFLAGSIPPMTWQKTVERAWPPCFRLGNSAWLSQLQSCEIGRGLCITASATNFFLYDCISSWLLLLPNLASLILHSC